jgi:hypothetical protein
MILLHEIIPIIHGRPLVTVRRNYVAPSSISRVIAQDAGCTVVFTSGEAVDYQETDVEVAALVQKDMVTA